MSSNNKPSAEDLIEDWAGFFSFITAMIFAGICSSFFILNNKIEVQNKQIIQLLQEQNKKIEIQK
jgi:hypothetical protein